MSHTMLIKRRMRQLKRTCSFVSYIEPTCFSHEMRMLMLRKEFPLKGFGGFHGWFFFVIQGREDLFCDLTASSTTEGRVTDNDQGYIRRNMRILLVLWRCASQSTWNTNETTDYNSRTKKLFQLRRIFAPIFRARERRFRLTLDAVLKSKLFKRRAAKNECKSSEARR